MTNQFKAAVAKVLEEVLDAAENDLQAAKYALEDGEYLANFQARGLLPEDEGRATQIVEGAYAEVEKLISSKSN